MFSYFFNYYCCCGGFLLFLVFGSFWVLPSVNADNAQNYQDFMKSMVSLNEKNYTLSSIEDIEMLTYFLMWKHDYFEKTPDYFNKNPPEANISSDDLDLLTETRLGEFIEKLKINHLITSTPSPQFNLTKTCSNETFKFLSTKPWWPKSDASYQKTKQLCDAASSCKSAQELIDLVGLTKTRTPTLSQSIARLCPLMLFQLQEKQCVEQREINFKAKNKPSLGAVWGFGFLFVTIVSFCSLVGVGFLPFLNENTFNVFLTVFQGLAVGSLVGSSLFHLIPQAFNLTSLHNYEYLWRALIIFSGIYLFFWSERIMRIIAEFRRRKKTKEISIPSSTSIDNETEKQRQVYFQNYNHSNNKTKEASPDDSGSFLNHKKNYSDGLNSSKSSSSPPTPTVISSVERDGNLTILQSNDNEENSRDSFINHNRERTNSNYSFLKHEHSHTHKSNEIATIAWMIILGDGLHNFIDGITIGAAFSQSILEGISISVAVICEEFPHELGDFAILIGSGMSMRKALGYNFLSACTCYFGMIFGIMLGDLSEATPYVFAFAGGMFLYISLVDMMGELTSKLDKASKRDMTYTAQILILQNIGIVIGVGIMFFLAKYSDKINFEGLAPPKNSDMPFTES